MADSLQLTNHALRLYLAFLFVILAQPESPYWPLHLPLPVLAVVCSLLVIPQPFLLVIPQRSGDSLLDCKEICAGLSKNTYEVDMR
jgi:hypothetical protein